MIKSSAECKPSEIRIEFETEEGPRKLSNSVACQRITNFPACFVLLVVHSVNWYGASQLAASLISLDRPERHGILVFYEHTISRDDRIGVGLAFRHFVAGKLLEFLIAGFEDDQ